MRADVLIAAYRAEKSPETRARLRKGFARDYGKRFADALCEMVECDELIRTNEAAIEEFAQKQAAERRASAAVARTRLRRLGLRQREASP